MLRRSDGGWYRAMRLFYGRAEPGHVVVLLVLIAGRVQRIQAASLPSRRPPDVVIVAGGWRTNERMRAGRDGCW